MIAFRREEAADDHARFIDTSGVHQAEVRVEIDDPVAHRLIDERARRVGLARHAPCARAVEVRLLRVTLEGHRLDPAKHAGEMSGEVIGG